MTCSHSGCERPARSKKSGICQTHYMRQLRGSEPRLSVVPLREYAKLVDRLDELPDLPQNDLGLSRVDRLCCEVLGVHPSFVYGEDYFQAA